MKCILKLHLVGILILVFCVACGHSVKQTVEPVIPTTAGDQFKRVVILPFADFTPVPHNGFAPGSSFYNDYYRRNALIIDAFQGALYRDGFLPAAPQEDIQKYLLDQGIIKGASISSISSLQDELQENWSDQMKEEIGSVISHEESRNQSQTPVKTVALNRQAVKSLGNAFGADYIVRGQVMEFRSDQVGTLNPLRTGIVPCILNSTHRTFGGIAEAEPYQQIDMDQDSADQYNRLRHMFFGLGALINPIIGEKGGRVPGSTVQISVLVHDAKTGDVVWFNRVETIAITRSAWADPDADLLFPKAIATSVNSLADDFTMALNSGRVPVSHEKQTAVESTGEGSEIESFATEVAAERAEQSAREAGESAEQASQSADEARDYAQQAGEAKVYAQQAEDSAEEAKDAVKRASEASVKTEKIFKKIIAK